MLPHQEGERRPVEGRPGPQQPGPSGHPQPEPRGALHHRAPALQPGGGGLRHQRGAAGL